MSTMLPGCTASKDIAGRQGEERRTNRLVAGCWLAGLAAAWVLGWMVARGSGPTVGSEYGVPPYHEDATLYGVHFVDAEEGWAVGDSGVIWHTVDGGSHWERQKSGTRASLRGVHFITPYTGWAVGRRDELGLGPIGIVLHTRDGGWHWEELNWNQLPPLHGVRFFDERHGVAWGDGSAAYPTGVFQTEDGGRTWHPATGVQVPLCRGAAFRPDMPIGVFGGLGGRWARWDGVSGNCQRGETDSAAVRNWYAVACDGQPSDQATWYMAGDGGAIRCSTDNGKSWQSVTPELPQGALAVCDFRVCVAFGKHVWVAGRTGRLVLHSSDRGQHWEQQRLELPLAIHGAYFLTDQIGWLVGELGVIHTTTDGGTTWKVQRVGGTRAASLCIHARAEQLPLEHVTVWGGAEGYRCAALILTSADERSIGWPEQAQEDRWGQAWRDCGGTALQRDWAFPLPLYAQNLSPRQLLAFWDRHQGASAAEHLLRRLVFAIRQWRPEILLSDPLDAQGPAEDRLTLQAVQEAFRCAADPETFPEQLKILGLEPWRVRKLFALTPAGVDRATLPDGKAIQPWGMLDAKEFHPFLADAPVDLAAEPIRLLKRQPWERRGWVLIAYRQGHAIAPADKVTSVQMLPDIWHDLEMTPGGAARRLLPHRTNDAETLSNRRQLAAIRRQLEQLCAQPLPATGEPEVWLTTCQRWLRQLPELEVARQAILLAERCQQNGRWQQAQLLFRWVAEQCPGHPASVAAWRWLLRHEAASELRQRLWPNTPIKVATANELTDPKQLPPVGRSDALIHEPLNWETHLPTLRLQRHLQEEVRWLAWGPLQAEDPTVRLSLLAIRRQLGRTDQAVRLARRWVPSGKEQAAKFAGIDAARALLATEVWLVEPQRFSAPPLPIYQAHRTDSRPLLDGQLEDACWKNASVATLQSATGHIATDSHEWLTCARFSWDEQYLYIAVRCGHPTGQQQAPLQRRPRDADLRGQDRVEILLDMDRDGQTYFRFCLDHRGAPAEDCAGDRSWNPRYFVAHTAAEQAWTAEWAIPWKELGLSQPPSSRLWAVQCLRIIPSRGVLSLSTPPGIDAITFPSALLRYVPE